MCLLVAWKQSVGFGCCLDAHSAGQTCCGKHRGLPRVRRRRRRLPSELNSIASIPSPAHACGEATLQIGQGSMPCLSHDSAAIASRAARQGQLDAKRKHGRATSGRGGMDGSHGALGAAMCAAKASAPRPDGSVGDLGAAQPCRPAVTQQAKGCQSEVSSCSATPEIRPGSEP